MFHGYVKLPEGQIILAPPAELDGLFANLPQPDPFRLRFCLFRRFPKSWRYPQNPPIISVRPWLSWNNHGPMVRDPPWPENPHGRAGRRVVPCQVWSHQRKRSLFSFHPQRGREQFPRDAGAGAAGLIWGTGGGGSLNWGPPYSTKRGLF